MAPSLPPSAPSSNMCQTCTNCWTTRECSGWGEERTEMWPLQYLMTDSNDFSINFQTIIICFEWRLKKKKREKCRESLLHGAFIAYLVATKLWKHESDQWCCYRLLKYGLFLSEMSKSPFSLKQVWTALHLIPLWINTGRKWMWFYNDSFHTGSIFFQRRPFKAALPSHVYYFLLLWHISIFSFDGFSTAHLYPVSVLDGCLRSGCFVFNWKLKHILEFLMHFPLTSLFFSSLMFLSCSVDRLRPLLKPCS